MHPHREYGLNKLEMDLNLSEQVLNFWIKPEENGHVFPGTTKQEQRQLAAIGCPSRVLTVTFHRDVEDAV